MMSTLFKIFNLTTLDICFTFSPNVKSALCLDQDNSDLSFNCLWKNKDSSQRFSLDKNKKNCIGSHCLLMKLSFFLLSSLILKFKAIHLMNLKQIIIYSKHKKQEKDHDCSTKSSESF